MKNLLISLSLATLSLCAVACKKTVDVAPADVAGTYTMAAASTYTEGNKTTTEIGNGTLTITSVDGSTIRVLEELPAFSQTYTAKVSGRTFTIDKYTENVQWNGKPFPSVVTGIVSVDGNTVKIDKATEVATGQSVLSKKVAITASKK